MEKYVHEYRETLINLEEDAYDLICVMSDMRKLQELKAELRQEGGCNMCKGLEEMMEDEKKKGIEQAEYLYKKLYYDNRLDDMKRAFENEDYRRQLMKEYGVQVEPYSFSKQ